MWPGCNVVLARYLGMVLRLAGPQVDALHVTTGRYWPIRQQRPLGLRISIGRDRRRRSMERCAQVLRFEAVRKRRSGRWWQGLFGARAGR